MIKISTEFVPIGSRGSESGGRSHVRISYGLLRCIVTGMPVPHFFVDDIICVLICDCWIPSCWSKDSLRYIKRYLKNRK